MLLLVLCANIILLASAGDSGGAKWTFERCLDDSDQGTFDKKFGDCFEFGAGALKLKSCSENGIVVDEYLQSTCDGEPKTTLTYLLKCEGGGASRINNYECTTDTVEETVEETVDGTSEEWDAVTIAGIVIGALVLLVSIISCIMCTRNNSGRTPNTI